MFDCKRFYELDHRIMIFDTKSEDRFRGVKAEEENVEEMASMVSVVDVGGEQGYSRGILR